MEKKVTATRVRQVTEKDFPSLYTLWKKAGLWVRSYADEEARFVSMISLYPSLCLVLVTDEDTVIGSILGSFDGRSVALHRLTVDPECQKKGYGALLVKKLEEIAKGKGIKKISAQVHVSNKKVLGFYEKQEYVEDPLITLVKEL
jgi:hypothetical protein